ncbi:MAG: polysaccharide biosynthesis tyrosine autokinase [Thermodesulfobacteriota bacterium]|nr:polysaccharide biosynthesis tyrosine autokinase [Thermodesulfobacteriota bacterium]
MKNTQNTETRIPDEYLEEEVHLRDYLRVILKRRWMIATVFLVLVTTVTISNLNMDPVYQATTQILIDKENPNVVNVEEVVGINAADRDYYQTQYEILKSKSLALKVIKDLDLKNSPEFAPKNGGFSLMGVLGSVLGWIKAITSSAEDAENPADKNFNPDHEYNSIIGAYLGRLNISPIRNSRLVDVSFEGGDPAIIARIANTHAKLYTESGLERKYSASEDAIAWLNLRIKEEAKILKEKETDIQRFREQEGLAAIDFEDRQGIIIQSLNDLNTALTQAETEKLKKENLFSELIRLSQQPEMVESMPSIATNQVIQELKSQYVALTGEYYNLSNKYGKEHPKMVRLSAAMKGIDKKIAQEVKKTLQSVETEYRVALAEEKSIRQAMEEKKREALALNAKQIGYNSLKREMETSRSLYESLLTRVKEAGLTEGLEATNIMVVDPARIPDYPVKPKKARNVLLSIIVGLTLGVGMAFFFEYLDNTINTPDELERYFKVPFLGVVSKFKTDTASEEIIVHSNPKSNVAEGFRTIRTNLLFSSPDVEKKHILITSALPRDGKTLQAANIAISFAKMGKKVLLIDADMRKARIHEIFNLERSPGLSEYLAGKESGPQPTEITGLEVFTAGRTSPNPAELLGSKRMKELLESERAKGDFDMIIIDSPPVLSVADAAILSAVTDGVVLVVNAGSTPKPAIQRAIQQLSDVEAKLIGCVLNNMDFEKESYYYSYYYRYKKYYDHYYGEEEEGKEKSKFAEAAEAIKRRLRRHT